MDVRIERNYKEKSIFNLANIKKEICLQDENKKET